MRFICLHGFLGQGRDWDAMRGFLCAYLPAPIEFICPDLFRRDAPPLADWGPWVEALEASLGAARDADIILGYSLGGRLALHALAARPGRWRAGVIISSAPEPIPNSCRAARRDWDRAWSQRFAHDPWPELLRDWNRLPVFQGSTARPRDEADFSRALLAAALELWSPARHAMTLEGLARLETPLLFCCGARDEKYCQLARDLKAQLRRGQVAIIPEAGHRLLDDAPQELARRIAVFLADVLADPAQPSIEG